eukprot:s216_g29.t1
MAKSLGPRPRPRQKRRPQGRQRQPPKKSHSPKGKAKGRGKGRRARGNNGEENGEGEAAENVAALARRSQEVDAIVESLREKVAFEVRDCLKLCASSGTYGVKGKHQHDLAQIDVGDDLQLSIYWTRNAVGLKKAIDGKMTQVCVMPKRKGGGPPSLLLDRVPGIDSFDFLGVLGLNAFVMLVVLVAFTTNLPKFATDKHMELSFGFAHMRERTYPEQFGWGTVKNMPKFKTRGEGCPKLANEEGLDGPQAFAEMSWDHDLDWSDSRLLPVILAPTASSLSEKTTPREKNDVKRTVPASEEKISPVKKALKGTDEGGERMTDVVEQSPVPTPSPPQPDPTGQAEVMRSLTLALDRISQLEAQLKANNEKPVPGSAASTPLSPSVAMMTPLSKVHSKSPDSSMSSAPTHGAEQDSGPGSEVEDGNANGKNGEIIEFPNGAGFMSHDALRMRLRRLCEEKPKTKKCHVDEKTKEQYIRGGEDREWLEIALVEALQKAEFKARVILVRERMEMKEQEVTGQWLTEEKMVKSGDYTQRWKYEYFVETSTKQTIRNTELYKRQEVCDAGDALQQKENQSLVRVLSCKPRHKLMEEVKKISNDLNTCFKDLAGVKAELLLQEDSSRDAISDELRKKIDQGKAAVKKPLILAEMKRAQTPAAKKAPKPKAQANSNGNGDGESAPVPKAKEDYKDYEDNEPYHQLLELVIASLDEASRKGASSCRALNYFMRSLYKSNVFICANDAKAIVAAGMHFLQGYARLAVLSFNLRGYASGLMINFATPMNLNEFRDSFEGFNQLPMTKLVQSMIQPAAHHASSWYTQVVKNPHFANMADAAGNAIHGGNQPAAAHGHPGGNPHHPGPHHGRRLFDFTNPFGHNVKTMDMSSVGPQNAAIDATGTYIITCQQQRLGCIRIQYFKNWDTMVTMVSAVQGGSTLPVDVPASWGCGSDKFQALEGGKESKTSFFHMMEESNTSTTWMMRVFGLLLTWAAVYCCFAPIAGAIDVVGDCIRGIPCLGQFLEDLLEGMVTCILCVVSCGCGCSAGLFVIAVVWLYMRPLIGGGLMLLCAALAAGAYFLGQSSKNKDSRNLVSELVPMTEGNDPGA